MRRVKGVSRYKTAGLILAALAAFLCIGLYLTYSDDTDTAKTVFVAKNLGRNRLITQVDTGKEKLVALTFDDGPDPRFTPDVLDILAQKKVRATFFVIGESAKRFPGLVEQAVLEGHEIENHTYSHPELDQGEPVSFYEELNRCERVITQAAGRCPVYFRPPKRLYNQEVIQTAERNGYQVVLWTVAMENKKDRQVKDVVTRVMAKVKPGAIILAHDGTLDRSLTVRSLPTLISELQKQGYRLVTLRELIAYHQD